jgi:uracil-DNA glycosylase
MDVTELMGKWSTAIVDELHQPYMQNIAGVVKRDEKVLQPALPDIFRALRLTPPDRVKLVILGQDPYGSNADGLAFSCKEVTPSLKVIFERLRIELGVERTNPDLTDWAEQGVLLLNTVLTNVTGQHGAHLDIGWPVFTNRLMNHLLEHYSRIPIMAWGRPAQDFAKSLRNTRDHLILSTNHPSAEARGSGYLFRPMFYRLTEYWEIQGTKPIIWSPSVGVPQEQST